MNSRLKRLILTVMPRRNAERARTLFAVILYYTGLAWLVSRGTKKRGGYIVMYHSIAGEDVYWDNRVRTDSFRRQVEWLKKNREVVQVQDFVDRINRRLPIPDSWVAVTFDDGYHDNLSNALPVLESMNAPASFYVTWNVLMGQQEFFYDRIQTAVMASRRSPLRIELDGRTFSCADGSVGNRMTLIQELVLQIRRKSEADRAADVKVIEAMCLDGDRPVLKAYLREEDLHELASSSLVKFGSHTLSHPDLASCDAQALEREVGASRRQLSGLLGQSVEGIAYPYGQASNYSENVSQRCRESGYRFALTTVYGQVTEASDPFQLPRVGVRDSLTRLKVNLMGVGV